MVGVVLCCGGCVVVGVLCCVVVGVLCCVVVGVLGWVCCGVVWFGLMWCGVCGVM